MTTRRSPSIRWAVPVLLGLLLGYASARMNVPGDSSGGAREWSPSIIWLPSYVICTSTTNGLGLRHTRSGWMFQGPYDPLLYRLASMIVGAGLGSVVALGLWARTRKLARADDTAKPPASR